eukprot:CAMPEP_0185593958 /NCGR_PEP_ID=MMETSP0434-20130131/73229_1 /TAXON_ID=626734 ORGANISM="Favella taraikaensis, Strain Fe Narragansett Bay" /NCGR_SAMPLE_ID=MMETSP0434 /ASSEMBLY_ACC=CAM_ASM_000379 /LENGTH=164 /DNA_ID=CAMNT_0028220941 /DNA_START=331 /DNA_END=825 /DNA_ORIENTATION=+
MTHLPIPLFLAGARIYRMRLVHHCFLFVVALSEVFLEEVVLACERLPAREEGEEARVTMLREALGALELQTKHSFLEKGALAETVYKVLLTTTLVLNLCEVLEHRDHDGAEQSIALSRERLHDRVVRCGAKSFLLHLGEVAVRQPAMMLNRECLSQILQVCFSG